MKGMFLAFATLVGFLLWSNAGATTVAGKITDAETGRPIPGATVFVYWGHMVHPYSVIVVVNDWWSCDGTAAATSNADGQYAFDLPLGASLHKSGDRAPQIRVVAPGYFDDRVFGERPYGSNTGSLMGSVPLRKHTDSENRWSPSLVPFGGLSLDGRIAALDLGTTEYLIGTQAGNVCEKSPAYSAYRAAIAQARADALCTKTSGLNAPRAATMQPSQRFARPDLPERSRQRYALLYRELVQPLIPSDPQAIVSHDAHANVCAWLRWQQSESSPDQHTTDDDPITLSVPVVNVADDHPVAHVPVRILWGQPPEHYPPAYGYFSAARGFVAETGDDGRVGLPVTRSMIEEQVLDFGAYNEQLRYAAIPISFDYVNFSSGPVTSDFRLDGRSILDHYVDHVDRVRPAGEIERLSSSEWVSLVNVGDPTFSRYPLNAPEVWRPSAAVREWFQLRSREEERQKEASRHPPNAVIPVYPWNWPAVALLWRADALADGPVAVESDRDRWAEIVRSQYIGTFDRLCQEPPQRLSPRETWLALKGLWWLEAQTLGRSIADEHAQHRAVGWDHGIQCRYEGEKMIRRGPSPTVFDAREFCAAWTAERTSVIGNVKLGAPPALDDLKPDFSRREKCNDAPNGGAFQ